ncbi:uncharacterized protein LOC143469868 [Clavelina lepadiformis]|uniref:uncharacterized protein LOC143469868 n=1 Tax=Clavelina lepadiformis TaxID=159417 RepID=UPI00404230EC
MSTSTPIRVSRTGGNNNQYERRESTNGIEPNGKINGMPIRKTSVQSRTTSISKASSSNDTRSMRNLSLESSNSIGSVGSMMFLHNRRQSSVGRITTSSIGQSTFDVDDEILIGDEKEFHDACRIGNVEVVESLVKSGIDVNCRNKHDRTPLHWTAGNGHLDILKMLIEDGATVDAADKFGMDALLWAAWFGQKSCVQYMMRVGAKPTARNKHGYVWLHCAAQKNHSNVIDILKEEMQDFDKNVVDDNGRSCLHIACRFGNVELTKKLVELGCNVKLKDKMGNSPLHTAAKFGFSEIVPVLKDAEGILEDVNSSHKTALHVAAEACKAAFCAELLKHGVDVNCETEEETCPLHLAVMGGHQDTAQVLINHDADVDAGNKHNQTPLHFAVMGADFILTKLLVDAGANPSIPDARSETVLHVSCENGLSDITELLLIANSDLSMKDLKGYTPMQVAARGNYVVLVDMLIKADRYQYYQITQQELPIEKGLMEPISFKPDVKSSTQQLRVLLYRLASKYLKPREWKQLAFYWGFTDQQLLMIEEQYTGSKSYKEHGHRMLLIWLHACSYHKQNPIKGLYEGLVGIQRRDLAETIRLKAGQNVDEKSCCIS